MNYVAGTICLCCGSSGPWPSSHSTCLNCGGNLELEYDHSALSRVFNRESLAVDTTTGILRYLPLLPVADPDLYPPLPVGGSPLLAPRRLRSSMALPHLFLKDDTRNPSASFKDRASAVALAHARESSASMVCAASTGNAGSSMACLCASVGQPCVVFVPAAAPRAKVAQLLMFGARVLAVRGTYDDAFDLSLEASARYGWYNRNTGTNPTTREGKKTCALEIAEQLHWRVPHKVLVPVGDGNIISGIWKGFRDLMACGLTRRMPQLVAVQSSGSDALSRSIRGLDGPIDPSTLEISTVRASTIADSISVDAPRDGLAAARAVLETGGMAITVHDSQILAAMSRLARETGVFAEPAGATALAGLESMLGEGLVDSSETVVVLVTGNGLKDVASALKAAGEPIPIEPDLDAAMEAIQNSGPLQTP